MKIFTCPIEVARVPRLALLLSVLCMISACGSIGNLQNPGPGQRAQAGLAILGVTARHGLKISINPDLMAKELAVRLSEREDLLLVPAAQVSLIVGAKPLARMMSTFARAGQLAPYQVQDLMAADLRTQRALMVRIESDETEKLPVVRQAVYNQNGARVVDRERRVYTTRRTTVVGASLLDLRTGRIVWTRQYRIRPETKSISKQYLGSSFTGSVAAEVANTVVNGFGGGNHPVAPSLQGSLRALIREVAFKIPAR